MKDMKLNTTQRHFVSMLKLMVMSLTLLLVSCASEQERAVLGKWKSADGTSSIEFFNEGTVTMIDELMPITGTYTFLEESRIKLDLGGLGAILGPMIAEIVFSKSKNQMILVFPSPIGSIRYDRIR